MSSNVSAAPPKVSACRWTRTSHWQLPPPPPLLPLLRPSTPTSSACHRMPRPTPLCTGSVDTRMAGAHGLAMVGLLRPCHWSCPGTGLPSFPCSVGLHLTGAPAGASWASTLLMRDRRLPSIGSNAGSSWVMQTGLTVWIWGTRCMHPTCKRMKRQEGREATLLWPPRPTGLASSLYAAAAAAGPHAAVGLGAGAAGSDRAWIQRLPRPAQGAVG